MKKTSLFFVFIFLYGNAIAQNLLDMSHWAIGTGSTGQFIQNGVDSENSRIWGIGPNGSQVILWRSQPNSGGEESGGWNHTAFTIDHTKMYRLVVWIKKTNSTTGGVYFGTDYVLNLDGTTNSNPYFWSGLLPELDKWYLLVGYVHGSDDNSTTSFGGIYDSSTGQKVISMTDYKLPVGGTVITHRTYLYYDTNTSDRQYFYAPRAEVVNGDEPSIAALLGLQGIANSTAINIDPDGKVGIGTASPKAVLDVAKYLSNSYGTILGRQSQGDTTGTGTFVGLKGYSTISTDKNFAIVHNFFGSENSSINFYRGSSSTGGFLTFGTGANTEKLRITADGNVGIGTTTPAEKLSVNGKVRAKEIKVEAANWPDYVFNQSYKNSSLQDLEKYILQNKHLPNVPSAKEVAANGIELGEMNKILLQKIEELTLHLIEKDKIIDKQEQRLKTIEEKLKIN